MASASDSRARARMARLIKRHMLAPFIWGREDCCLSVCNVLRGLGFGDPAEAFRGRYSDETGARYVMGGTVEDVAHRICQARRWPEIAPETAADGDVGVVGNSLAIFADGWWHVKSLGGYILKRRVRRAWRPS